MMAGGQLGGRQSYRESAEYQRLSSIILIEADAPRMERAVVVRKGREEVKETAACEIRSGSSGRRERCDRDDGRASWSRNQIE